MMDMEVHSASSPQILSLFPQTTIETEKMMEFPTSGLSENPSGFSESELGSSMREFQRHPLENPAHPSEFQVGPPEQTVYQPIFEATPLDQEVYAYPLAEHEALVADSAHFYNRFNSFQDTMGPRLTVPTIGGKELDLHLLYKQVTDCGGLEQVIKESRWKEIAVALKIPSSIINPSFVLRKHYIDLLYHFEQVHYFGAQGHFTPPPGPLPAPHPCEKSSDSKIIYHSPVVQEQLRKKKKNKVDSSDLSGVDPGASLGQIVTGAINKKFDNGYLVTVVVGSEKLKGVLYHVPTENVVQQYATVPHLMLNIGRELNGDERNVYLSRKNNQRAAKKDPNAPRRSRNGYSFFYVEQLARLKKLYPQPNPRIRRMVVDMWNGLAEEEKLPYHERSEQDKKRYKIEMTAYKEKLHSRPSTEDYSGDNAPEVAGQQNEENGIAEYFNDVSCDYHVSLEAETDPNSFHAHQQEGIRPEVTGVAVTDHQAYAVEGNGHVYSVQFPQPQISESDHGQAIYLPQTYEASGDHCFYQTQSNACQSSYVPCTVTSDQMYWMQGTQSYNVQDDGPTLSLYPQTPFG